MYLGGIEGGGKEAVLRIYLYLTRDLQVQVPDGRR